MSKSKPHIESERWMAWQGNAKDGGADLVDATTDAYMPEPPCKHCIYFYPVTLIEYKPAIGRNQYAGIRLCHAQKMEPDFSCWTSGGGLSNEEI